jgi:hypothetical protein
MCALCLAHARHLPTRMAASSRYWLLPRRVCWWLSCAAVPAIYLGLGGRIEIIRSLDGGQTWTPPNVVADSDRDDRNPALGVARSGTLILAYHCQGNYDAAGNYLRNDQQVPTRVAVMITRSHDNGLTWEPPFPLELADLRHGSPFGKIVTLADGRLLLPIYHPTGSYVVRSADDGITWGEPTRIAAGKNETALVALPNGDLVAALRGEDGEQALHIAHSQDGGATWSAPVQLTGLRQHPADMVVLHDGSLLLTYGNRTPPYRIEGRISWDGGHAWLDRLLTFSGQLYGYTVDADRPTDLGYPSNAVYGGQGVTLYYYNPAVNQPWNWASREHEARYKVTNYCAIAVRWDEAQLIQALR